MPAPARLGGSSGGRRVTDGEPGDAAWSSSETSVPAPLAPLSTTSDRDRVLIDQPLHRFDHGFERTVARTIVEQALRFDDAAARTVGDMIIGRGRLVLGHGRVPLFPGQEAEPRRSPK